MFYYFPSVRTYEPWMILGVREGGGCLCYHDTCTIIVGSSSSGQSTDNLHTMITRTLNNHPDIMGENFMCMNILMR